MALLAAAEGAGHRRAAARVDAPAGTVRGWLRAVRAAGLRGGCQMVCVREMRKSPE